MSNKKKLKSLFDNLWPRMEPVIKKLIHQKAVTREEWHELFGFVCEIVCCDGGALKLYNKLKNIISCFVFNIYESILSRKDDQVLLRAYEAEWGMFVFNCYYFPAPFIHLDLWLKSKAKVTKNKETSVRRFMIDTWSKCIISKMKDKLQNAAMNSVNRERNGEVLDSPLGVEIRDFFVNMGINEEKREIYKYFEQTYIAATEAFYLTKSKECLKVSGVLNCVNEKLKEEKQLATKYLYPSSLQLLTEYCVEILIKAYKKSILAEFPLMIIKNETENLRIVYEIFQTFPDAMASVSNDLHSIITEKGIDDMVASAEIIIQDAQKYVEKLLELFKRFNKLIQEAFNNNPIFLTSRDKAYKEVVNNTSIFRLELNSKQNGSVVRKIQPESRSPELLAIYCDLLLRKTPVSKKLTLDEIEEKINDVCIVLKYVENKDVFMRYYKAYLIRRLILNTSVDIEMEENVVGKLRVIGIPYDFIRILSVMFRDIKINESLNQDFANELGHKGRIADRINIKILNSGSWLTCSERTNVSLPLELEDIIPEVEEFYKQKHKGRKLQWHHYLSNGTITFVTQAGKYDLGVTTFQMSVLFAWNERKFDRISFEDLKLATELPDAELRRVLWSLVAFPKLKSQVLLYSPKIMSSKDFDDSTLFWVNQDFSIIKSNKPQKRGKLNLIGKLQLFTGKHREEDNSIVLLRVQRTQEAIMKIMKARKRITYSELLTELIEMLKNMFLPSRKVFKEQIDWLIDHGYIKRHKNDINVFIYNV